MSCWKTRISAIRPSEIRNSSTTSTVADRPVAFAVHVWVVTWTAVVAAAEHLGRADRALPVLGERGAHGVHAVGAVVPAAVGQRGRLLDAQVGVQQRPSAVAVAGPEPAAQLLDDVGGVAHAADAGRSSVIPSRPAVLPRSTLRCVSASQPSSRRTKSAGSDRPSGWG